MGGLQILLKFALIISISWADQGGQEVKWGNSNQAPQIISASSDYSSTGFARFENEGEIIKLKPADSIQQPLKDPLNIMQVLSSKLFSKQKEEICQVGDKRRGVYSCSGQDTCSNNMLMQLRNTILDDCLTGIFTSKNNDKFGECQCCDEIDKFISKYSMNGFLLCACSKKLICEELGTVTYLIDPFAKFQRCGVTIQNQPTC